MQKTWRGGTPQKEAGGTRGLLSEASPSRTATPLNSSRVVLPPPLRSSLPSGAPLRRSPKHPGFRPSLLPVCGEAVSQSPEVRPFRGAPPSAAAGDAWVEHAAAFPPRGGEAKSNTEEKRTPPIRPQAVEDGGSGSRRQRVAGYRSGHFPFFFPSSLGCPNSIPGSKGSRQPCASLRDEAQKKPRLPPLSEAAARPLMAVSAPPGGLLAMRAAQCAHGVGARGGPPAMESGATRGSARDRENKPRQSHTTQYRRNPMEGGVSHN